MKKTDICKNKNLLVIKNCYCQNGHNLINNRAIFNGFEGIMIKVKRYKKAGLVALSPVYGYKSRVSLELTFKADEIWNVYCPTCDEKLPVFSKCSCGGDLVTLFLDNDADFANCILICNRIDCFNAEIKYNSEIIHYSGVDALI
jgi:hypothetical protein